MADYAWFDKNSESKTHVIGTKLPNELGIFDMSGNVLEWCQDWHQDWSKSKVFSSSIQTNPICQTGEKGHVIRGGVGRRMQITVVLPIVIYSYILMEKMDEILG